MELLHVGGCHCSFVMLAFVIILCQHNKATQANSTSQLPSTTSEAPTTSSAPHTTTTQAYITSKLTTSAAPTTTKSLAPSTTTVQPPTLSGLCNVTSQNATSIKFSWSPSSPTNDIVYTLNSTSVNVYADSSTTTLTIPNLSPGSFHSFQLQAKNTKSNLTSDTLVCSGWTAPTLSGLCKVTSQNATSIKFSWSPSSPTNDIVYTLNSTSVNVYADSSTTTLTIPNLSPGSFHSFQLQAKNTKSNLTSDTLVCSGWTAPTLSGLCKVTSQNATSIKFSWSPSSPTNDIVYTLNSTSVNVYANSSKTTLTIPNLSPGSFYSFQMQAKNTKSNLTSDTLVCSGWTAPTLSGLCKVTSQNATSIKFSWSPSSPTNDIVYTLNSTSVNVYADSSTTTLTIPNLSPGSFHSFQLQAKNTKSNLTSDTLVCSGWTAPTLSGLCNVTSQNATSITFSWSPTSSTNNIVYNLKNEYISVFANSSTTTLTIPNLSPGLFLSFQLQATSTESSLTSNTLVCRGWTDPDKPAITQFSAVTTISVTLSWSTGNTSVINSTDVCYKDISSKQARCNSSTAASKSREISDLLPGRTYQFNVTVTSFSKSSTSTTVEQTTVPLPPSVVRMVGTASNMLNITWTPSVNSIQSSFNVTYQLCNDTQIRQVSFNDSCTMTSCNVQVEPDDPAGSSYIGHVFSVSNKQQSFISANASAFTVPNEPQVYCSSSSSSSISLTLIPNGTVDFYSITTQCPSERIPQKQCNETITTIATRNVVQLVDGLNAFKVYRFRVLAVKNSTAYGSSSLCKADSTGSSLLASVPNIINCTTSESAPSAVRNFTYVNTAGQFLPWSVNLTWMTPSNPNGVIRHYCINYTGNYSNTAEDHPATSIITDVQSVLQSFNVDDPDATFAYQLTSLIAGYSYNVSIQASTGAGFGDPVYITFTTRVEPPFDLKLQQAVNPINATSHSLLVFIKDTFSNKTGRITKHQIIVSQLAIASLNATVSIFWAASDGTKQPYVAIDCPQFFDSQCPLAATRRRRRSTYDDGGFPVFVGANDSCSTTVGTGLCNGNLQPSTVYYILYRTCNEFDMCSTIISTSLQTTPGLPGHPGTPIVAIVLGVVLPIIAIVILVILVLFLRQRQCHFRWRSTDSKDSSGESVPVGPSLRKQSIAKKIKSTKSTIRSHMSIAPVRPVPKTEFPAHVNFMSKDSNLEFSAEYENLKLVGRDQVMEAAEAVYNRTKNRYTDIKPYDISRVKLLPIEDEDGSDYINASWMPGFNSRREFIAAQGPLPSTMDDFWRMIWEYNCRGVVMLTKCIEKGRNKCERYWPTHTEPVVYGDLQIAVVEQEITDTWHISDLSISMGQQSRRIKHFFYQAWPDCDIPTETETFVKFLRLVRNDLPTRGGPVVVHCSAGVGRTGTFIAIDTLVQQLERSTDPTIDVYGTVYRLRMNRVLMVQTEAQYVFIHKILKSLMEVETGQEKFHFGDEDMYQNQTEFQNSNFLQTTAAVAEVNVPLS